MTLEKLLRAVRTGARPPAPPALPLRLGEGWGRGTAVGLAVLVLLGTAVNARSQSAEDKLATFFMGRVRYSNNDGNDCGGVGQDLMKLVSRASTLKVQEERKVRLTDPELYETPFLFMNGHNDFVLTEAEITNLRKYLSHGGFFFASGCCSNPGFPRAWNREFSRIFPNEKVKPIPYDHLIYRSFYRLDRIRCLNEPRDIQLEGLFYQGNLVAVMCQDGLCCSFSANNTYDGSAELKLGDVGPIQRPSGPGRRESVHVHVDGRGANRRAARATVLPAGSVGRARGQLGELPERASVQGHRLHRLRVDHLADFGAGGVEHWRGGADRHFLGGLAELQHDVDGGLLRNLKLDVGNRSRFEARLVGGNRIMSRGQLRDRIVPLVIRYGRPGECGAEVLGGYRGMDDRGAGGVFDGTQQGRGADLSFRNGSGGADTERQQKAIEALRSRHNPSFRNRISNFP